MSFRVAKGVTYRVGARRGTYVRGPDELKMIDNGGHLYVTDQRVLYTSTHQNRERAFTELVDIHNEDGITFMAVTNRQKTSGFVYGSSIAEAVEDSSSKETTTTIPALVYDSAECTVFQAAMWFASDYADIEAVSESATAAIDLGVALAKIGAPGDDISEQVELGTSALALWLLKQAKTTVLYEGGQFQVAPATLCAYVVGTGISLNTEGMDDDITKLVETYAQIYAGRYDLPGKQLSEAEMNALETELDPDGDGVYFTHSGQGDSEDFLAPAMLRVTYTGTGPTCSFDLVVSATGERLDFVSGLGGGGFIRLNLSISKPTEVYVSDVIGCRGGELQFGPNP